ncbi:MAG: enolase-like domain-containing protein [Planctomycetota bacterium]
MNNSRRDFLKALAALTLTSHQLMKLPKALAARTGLKIKSLETFTQGHVSFVRIRTDDGSEGFGQISTYDADISATVFHRKIAPHALGADPTQIDTLVDRCIEANYKYPWSYVCRALAGANYKYPWSYVCRALAGLDTAIWDLLAKREKKSVCELLGATPRPIPAYASSMRRDITPKDEADRLVRLRDTYGFRAFKIRIGKVCGHDQDQWPGRTEAIVPTVRKAIGDDLGSAEYSKTTTSATSKNPAHTGSSNGPPR